MNLKRRAEEILSAIKLRTFHLIVTAMSLVVITTVMFLLLRSFLDMYFEQLALTASQSVESLGIGEEVNLAIQASARDIAVELSLWIIVILVFGMVVNFIFYDVIFLKFIIQPLTRINDQATLMIENHDQLGKQIPAPMFKELQTFTETFNRMSRELKSQMLTLEEQVQKRTKELEKAKENIEHQANHDTLTGLPNRRLFNEHVSQAIKLARRKNQKFSLLMIDLNQFKKINDTYGHMVGDQVLKKVAARFREGLRDSDVISRWGGDEFAILAFDIINKSDTVKIITRIYNAFDHPIDASGRSFMIKMCIGIAIYPNDGENQRTLFKNADAALYQAKHRQTNGSYRFFQGESHLNDDGPLID